MGWFLEKQCWGCPDVSMRSSRSNCRRSWAGDVVMGAQSRWSRNAAQAPTTQVHLRPHNVAPHPTLALLELGIREQVALVASPQSGACYLRWYGFYPLKSMKCIYLHALCLFDMDNKWVGFLTLPSNCKLQTTWVNHSSARLGRWALSFGLSRWQWCAAGTRYKTNNTRTYASTPHAIPCHENWTGWDVTWYHFKFPPIPPSYSDLVLQNEPGRLK